MNAMQISHLRAIANYIEAGAPEVATRETHRNHFEGEEEFEVTYNNHIFTCIHRIAFLDTSNLDFYNGTGKSYEIIYDEVAVLNAYDTKAEADDEALAYDLNEILCLT